MPRILVADDSVGIRNSLRALLSNLENWVVCGEAADGEQAITLAQKLKPDLIVLDFAMPVRDGLAAAVEILKREPSVPIVLFTLHMSVTLEHTAKKMGIRRVVSKGDSTSALLQTLREVMEELGAPVIKPGSEPQSLPNQPSAADDGPHGC